MESFILSPVHESPGTGTFKEGVATFMTKGKYGYIDKSSNVVIPCIYEEAHFFTDGIARVKLDGKWFFIDKEGKEVVNKQ